MFQVHFFDGKTSKQQAAQLDMDGDELRLTGAFGERRGRLCDLDISEALDNAPRFIRFPDGGMCEIASHDLAEFAAWLARHGRRHGWVAQLQMRWRNAFAALLVCFASVFAAYLWVLPAGAEYLAPHIPPAALQALSDQVLETLDGRLLAPSQLPAQRRDAIAREFSALLATQSGLPAYRLHFRAAKGVGPNAFALPSGEIVVFDSLVGLADDTSGVVAVLAHELGHLHYRHGVRRLIQSSVVSFAIGMYLGDISSLATGLSTLLLESRYSREFEHEADAYAVSLLRQGGRDPVGLANMLAKLQASQGGDSGRSLLASHPDTQSRIDFIEASRR